MLNFEKKIWNEGYQYIAGVDEAGRGPLAGPVVAAAVIFPRDVFIEGVNDSKQMTEQDREIKFIQIQSQCIAYGIGISTAQTIDKINILEATKRAAIDALSFLRTQPDYIITDFLKIKYLDKKVLPIIKGDAQSHTIAAASILAKVTRDNLMEEYHKEFPMYGFAQNKGYPTQAHMDAIDKHGPSTLHRLTFKGVCWFNTVNVYSQTFKKISERIANCQSSNELNKIELLVNQVSSFLPEMEIDLLKNKICDLTK